MKPQKTINAAAAVPNRVKSAETKHKSLFSVLHIPVAEPWSISKNQVQVADKENIKNKQTPSPTPTTKSTTVLNREKEEKNIVEKIWSARLTGSNNKAAKAFELLLKLVATLFLLAGVICFAFLAFAARANTKSSEEDRYSDSGGPIHDVDYFDTLWNGGSYETQQRMMP